jgi:uncharacterized membrane protein YphA (DoxX/SURF4 family)
MNLALWITQGLLAAMFIMAGITKSTQSKEKLEKQFPWVKDFSLNTVRFIGISEFLSAIGLIIPWLTGIAPVLTPIAALGIAIIMILATVTVHLKKREYKEIGLNIFILLMSAFVAYGRF